MPANDPILTCLFIADSLVHDSIKNMWGAIGLHNCIRGPGFPLGMESLWWFARVADAPPQIDLRATLVHPNGAIISTKEQHFSLPDIPLAHAGGVDGWWEIGGRFREVLFPGPGRYSVGFAINGRVLGETALNVLFVPPAPPPIAG